MKPKKFNKKLVLRKKTIADLSNGRLDNVKGGFTPSPCHISDDTCLITCRTCNTCDTCPSAGLRIACCETVGELTCYPETICGSLPCC